MFRYSRVPLLIALAVGSACADSAVGPTGEADDLDDITPRVELLVERIDLYAVAEEAALNPIRVDGADGPLAWSSSDPDVASVSSSGQVTALANGESWIFVQPDDGAGDSLLVAVDVSSWKAVTAGEGFACGLSDDGQAFCWGDNTSGQVGIGSDKAEVSQPTRVVGAPRFSMIDAGESHVCAVVERGGAYCWGQNRHGELGVGDDRVESRVPVRVVTDNLFDRFVRVAAGFTSSCALDEQGFAFCWGDNRAGQLGDGTNVERRMATPVANHLRFQRIDVGASHACAVTGIGAAYCWGSNATGALGTGTTESSPVPVVVESEGRWIALYTGLDHTCGSGAELVPGYGGSLGIQGNGEGFCWGLNDRRQLVSDSGFCNPDLPLRCSAQPLRLPLQPFDWYSIGRFRPSFTCVGHECWGMKTEGPTRVLPEGMGFSRVVIGLEKSYAIDDAGLLYRWPTLALDRGLQVSMERVADRRVGS